jgi:hypothetical protein
MATSIHADTYWQPPPTVQSGPRLSMFGSRRRALSIRRDQQCNPPPGPTSPLEVNVTMPNRRMGWDWFEALTARLPLPAPRITRPWAPRAG